MLKKILKQSIDQACDCPFYVTDIKGNQGCFIKQTLSAPVATALVKNNEDYDTDLWDIDCKGEYDNCSIIPLLWDLDSEEEEEEEVVVIGAADNYDPFEEESEESEESDDSEEEEEESDDSEEEEEEYPVKISIHKLDNPYLVKSDVLFYPTNNLLTIDDAQLNRMSRGMVQEECDKIPRPIQMGHVYPTSNGGPESVVKSNRILHAVVAGASRLVNENDIRSSVRKGLLWAEAQGAQSIVMIPCDCGTYDIHYTASIQLATIKTFLRTTDIFHLKNIFLVMEDDESVKAFEYYYKRVFGDKD